MGIPTVEFEPVVIDPARFRPSYRPDTILDGWSTDSFCVRAASVRGDDHRFRGTPRQDDFALGFHESSGSLVIAVADGVSAAKHSQFGSTAACRYALDSIMRQVDAGTEIDWPALLKGSAWAVVETAQRLSGAAEPDPAAAEDLCGTTLCAVLVTPNADGADGADVLGVCAGDSGMLRISSGGFVPIVGGKTAEDGISSSAVVALPRVSEDVVVQHATLSAGDVLLVATDGILDPLGQGRGLLGRFYLESLSTPPDIGQFGRLVDFSRETFDDDRTLVAVWPMPGGPAQLDPAARRRTLLGQSDSEDVEDGDDAADSADSPAGSTAET